MLIMCSFMCVMLNLHTSLVVKNILITSLTTLSPHDIIFLQVQRSALINKVFARELLQGTCSISLLSYISSCDEAWRFGLTALFSVLFEQGAAPSHPLMTYLRERCLAHSTVDGVSSLEELIIAWAKSNAVTAEDAFIFVGAAVVPQVEALVSALEYKRGGGHDLEMTHTSLLYSPDFLVQTLNSFTNRPMKSSNELQIHESSHLKVYIISGYRRSRISNCIRFRLSYALDLSISPLLLQVAALQENLLRLRGKTTEVLTLMTEGARQALRSSIRSCLHPLITAVQQTRRLHRDLPELLPTYPALPELTQYNISGAPSRMESKFFEDVDGYFIRAIKKNSDMDTIYSSFLIFQAPTGKSIADLSQLTISATASLKPILSDIQRRVPVVRLLEGIEFTGLQDSVVLVYEWDPTWKSIETVGRQHGGLLFSGHFELFSVICQRLLATLAELHAEDYLVRSLSPSTVLIDQSGRDIRLLLLPTLSTADRPNDDFLDTFIATARLRPEESSSLPDQGREKSRTETAWDTWGLGMCMYTLAFGKTFSSSQYSEGPHSQVDDTFLDELVKGFYEDQARQYIDHGANDHRAVQEGKVMSDLLGAATTEMVFRVYALKMGHSLTQLQVRITIVTPKNVLFSLSYNLRVPSIQIFRSVFTAQAADFGIVLSSAAVLWERIVASIYSTVSGGLSSYKALEERVTRMCKMKSTDGLKEFCETSLGVVRNIFA